jgi:hypothetical protein
MLWLWCLLTLVAQQAVGLAVPITRTLSLHRSRLRWEGKLQPTPLSVLYTVRIEATPTRRPRVSVISPPLDEDARELPHVFRDGTLCLCYPWQWDHTKSIVRTIVPWTSEWLLHYELWKITRQWHGGGHEDAPDLD